MPTCQNCGEKWSWKQTLKKSFTLDTGMECPYCERKQYLTTKSRRKSGLSNLIIIPVLALPVLFNISPAIVITLLIGTGLALLGFHPFLIELSNQEEPMW